MNKLFFLISLISFQNIYAQKLPSVQQKSLRAPANVKIDGKTNEWGKLQAYNPATELFYTIANDDKTLYLTIQATDWNTLTNIANGGIKLAIQKTGTRDDTRAPFIKFPYLEKGKKISVAPKDVERGAPDSVMIKNNKQLTTNIKWIYTKGLEGLDTLISIYNTSGITTANAFDIEKNYNLEIAINLSLFGLSVDNPSKFSYHIMVNAEPNRYTHDSNIAYIRRVFSINNWSGVGQQSAGLENFENYANKTTATTDFWGEYTLAK